MKKKITIFATAMVLAGMSTACSQVDQRTASYGVGGAGLGAVAGAVLSGTGTGAFTGAVVGGAAGTVIGSSVARNDRSGSICTYRDAENRTFRAPCHP